MLETDAMIATQPTSPVPQMSLPVSKEAMLLTTCYNEIMNKDALPHAL